MSNVSDLLFRGLGAFRPLPNQIQELGVQSSRSHQKPWELCNASCTQKSMVKMMRKATRKGRTRLHKGPRPRCLSVEEYTAFVQKSLNVYICYTREETLLRHFLKSKGSCLYICFSSDKFDGVFLKVLDLIAILNDTEIQSKGKFQKKLATVSKWHKRFFSWRNAPSHGREIWISKSRAS